MKKMYLLLSVSLVVLWASASPNNTNLKDRYETQNKQRAQVERLAELLANGTSSQFKSASALTFLDKVTDNKGGYTNMSYTTDGKLLVLEVFADYDLDGVATVDQKIVLDYDIHGNETLFERWEYDLFDDKLLMKEKEEMTWDNQDRMLTEVSYEWDDNANQCIPDGKSTYTYSGLTAVVEQMAYNPTTQTYSKAAKMELTLNSQNQGLSAKIYNWDNDTQQYVYSGKMTNTYNAKGELTKTVITGIDEESGLEVDGIIVELVYNSKGLLTQDISQMNMEGTLVTMSESRYEYNSNDRLIKSEDFVYNWMTGVSSLTSRSEYDYENNQLKEERVYEPEWGTSELALVSKYEFTYQADTDALNIARPNTDYVDMFFGYEYFESGRLLKVREYQIDYDSGQLDFDIEKTFHYSNNPGTGADRFETSTLKAYPVPFDNYLNIETGANTQKQVALYSVQGQRLLQTQLEQRATLQTGHLPSGVYVLETIDSNGAKQVHRIVKKSIN